MKVDRASDRPAAPATVSDLELLRRFEPVAYFTNGEPFFPTDVGHYVRDCSLWERYPDGHEKLLVKQGELTLEKLVEPRPAAFGTVRFLRFIENLSLTESAQVLADQARLRLKLRNNFHAGIGRLARGGFLPRLVDGLFSLSFLLRGRVSAATAAAAELDYYEMLKEEPKYVYYGRVARQNGWTILQYWFFFCFNNWRSGFHGVNNHESDWEMITIYLYEDGGQLIPEWVAYASHDFKGDDLRRRWDDHGELQVNEECHPVIYAGAGSHASYFRPGEYQAEVNLPLPSWFSGLMRTWNKFWTETLGQPAGNPFRIPFVDFARGDGLRIGPGAPQSWSPVLIDESTAWVSQYRGLWGLFARDPVSGENAPAGPMYNRDGTPRSSWYDPLGFAGMDKVPPPPQALELLRSNCDKVVHRQEELEQLTSEKAGELQSLGIKMKGMEGNPHLAKQHTALEKTISVLADEVKGLRRERSENTALLQGLTQQLERLNAGEPDDPRAHIRHLAEPDKPTQAFRFDRAAETWAAISLSLLLFAIAGLIFFAPHYVWAGLTIIFLLFLVAESILRAAFVQTIARITLILAMVATLILFFHFWKWIIVGALLTTGAFLMFQRLRELTG
jgi:hypothetical protein